VRDARVRSAGREARVGPPRASRPLRGRVGRDADARDAVTVHGGHPEAVTVYVDDVTDLGTRFNANWTRPPTIW
jgi:hypothetical protein